MSMFNRMHDRLRKLYRLVLVRMRNIEAAIALPPSPRKTAGLGNLYAGHRLESLESRTLLSSSAPVFDLGQGDTGNGQAPIVIDFVDSGPDAAGDDQDMGFNTSGVEGVDVPDAKLVSVTAGGTTASGYSSTASISADGNFIVFLSDASDLVADDTNDVADIFIYNRLTGEIERLSVDVNGTQSNGPSYDAVISSNGRYVSFTSEASNLVPGDTNGFGDIFVYDRQLNELERVSLSDGGAQGNDHSGISTISDDGRFVSFTSDASNLVAGDTNGATDIFVYDRQSSLIVRVSVTDGGVQGNGISENSTISADGRFVSFESDASNLVAGDTNNATDVFVYTLETSLIERVSVDSDGIEGNSESYYSDISADGRYVTFMSDANNLVPDDTNNAYDIFVYDRDTNFIERVSVSSNGTESNGDNETPSISGDGRYVSFESNATNLVPDDTNGDWDVFVYDRQTLQIQLVSLGVDGVQGNDYSGEASISADGRFVVFTSDADNLISNDNNENRDVFVVDWAASLDDEPEVEVSGNDYEILNDDTTPDSNDGTDFGVVTQGDDAVSMSFTVYNTGTATLTISDLTVPDGFTIIQGLPDSIEAGQSDTFTVQLDTDTTGTKSGDIYFTTNDSDEETFSFSITGTVNEPNEVELPNLTVTLDDSRIVTSIVAGTATRMILPITVSNGGNIALASNTRIDIQIFARPVEGGDDILLTTLSNQNVSGLRAGASKRINAIFTLPAEINTDDYVLVTNIDSQNVVEESNEDDNEAVGTRAIAIAEPFVNLTVTLDDSRIVTSIVAGTATRMILPITVSNGGNIALASNTRIDIQIFARPVEGGDDILLTTLSNQNVSGLRAGASKRINAIFTLPAEINTDDYVLVTNIDSQNVVEESNEDDNEAVGTRAIAIAEPFVNLTVTLCDSNIHTSIVAGTATRITLPINVCNQGNIALAPKSKIDIQVFARPAGGGDDILLTTLTNQYASNLRANTSTRYYATFTIPADLDANDYELVAKIDSQNVVEESNEDDNEAVGTRTITIAEPFVNLTSTLNDSRIPASIVAGSSTRITLPITVSNGGNIALASNVRIAIEVFARPVDGGDDILLTTLTNQNVSNLRAGASKRINATFTLPAEIDTDDYVLVTNVDSLNALNEFNEGDNLAVGTKVISIFENIEI